MTAHVQKLIPIFLGLLIITNPFSAESLGTSAAADDLRESLHSTLRLPSDDDIAAARSAAASQLEIVQKELSTHAIGAVLSLELQIDELSRQLEQVRPDPLVLRKIEQSLRQSLVGRIGPLVNKLRHQVHTLASLSALTSERMTDVATAIDQIFNDIELSEQESSEAAEAHCRRSFAMLADLHPSATHVEELRQRLATPNHKIRIGRDYVTSISNRTFELPVQFRRNINSTDISGNGTMKISTSVELPLSEGESQLRIQVSGTGNIDLSAHRDIAHLRAVTAAKVTASQLIAFGSSGLSGESPVVDARFRTRLTGICLDGILGKCQLARDIAGQVAQNEMAQNDVSSAAEFRRTAKTRIEDEGYDIAYKINELIEHGFWDRLQAIDVDPEVKIRNDEFGIFSQASFARHDQLAALFSAPEIPSSVLEKLDLITWLHESAINNVSDQLSGVRLDEATIRGLWEVELKLTSDEWQTAPRGKIPAGITLADAQPLQIRFSSQGLDLVLRTASCDLEGEIRDEVAREFHFRYQLTHDEHGACFIREGFTASEPIPADIDPLWQEVLGRFFGKSIRPMPKFQNRDFPQFLQIGYLQLDKGWLTVGAARTSVVSPVMTQAPVVRP